VGEEPTCNPQVPLTPRRNPKEAIEKRGGYVFKTVGDAFCCAFLTTLDALEAALEAQGTLLGEEWEGTGPISVRMALHTGAHPRQTSKTS
jgi:class 3 adenylate cyclase